MRTRGQGDSPRHFGHRLAWSTGVLGLVVFAYGWGRFGAPPRATAAPPQGQSPAAADPTQRWVAVIYGNVPVTRDDFGEYLIARHTDKLELLVNKRIIELACRKRGVEVTDAEVEVALGEDLKGMQVSLKDFVEKILKKYNKTLYEWKEDVIRPRLAMTRMCQDRVQVTDEDYRKAFEAYYGEKVECRLILFPTGEDKVALQMYGELRKSDEDFDRIAKQQASPTLAATGGRITPIGRYTTGNEELEKEAFSLRPGEVSRLIGTPEGTVVLKCIGRKPADSSKNLAAEKPKLEKEIREKKIQMEMPKLFKELQEEAQPKLFVKKQPTQEELEREVKRELQGGVVPAGATAPKPPR
jgi:hypothetical protein